MNQWKIDDTLFYPMGLFNISSEDKTVFVTWSYDSLISQIFKKADDGQKLTDQFLIPVEDVVKAIVLTQHNTLVLLENGHIKYFSSFKNIKDVNFTENVRYLSPCYNGFVLIRIENVKDSKRIILEHYKDVKNLEEIVYFQHFDITYDELNIFDSVYEMENFVVRCFEIKERNKNFFELISKNKIVSNCMIYIFSINGNLFCLLNDNEQNEENNMIIHQILSVSSDITRIEYIENNNILLIFLACGAIELLFESEVFQVLDRNRYYAGCDIIACTFSNENFFYSDGERIVKVAFDFELETNSIKYYEEDQFLPGIIALTWVETIGKLVCLSENNIFYRAKFTLKIKKTSLPTTHDLQEITPERFTQFDRNKQLLVTLLEEPKKLQSVIKDEINKQALIAIASQKEIHSQPIKCKIEYRPFLPSHLRGNIIYPNESVCYDSNSYFAIITLDLKKSEIFFNKNWNLLIHLRNDHGIDQLNNISISEHFWIDDIIVILHLKKTEFLLPKVHLELNTTVQCDSDFQYISIPIKIDSENITQLFQNCVNMIDFRSNCSLSRKISELFDKNCLIDFNNFEENEIEFVRKTSITLNSSEICQWFNYSANTEIDLEMNIEFFVYFFGIKIKVEYDVKENLLKIKSKSPIAMYFCKNMLADKINLDVKKLDFKNEKRMLLTLQSELQNGEDKSLEQLKSIFSTLKSKTCI